MIPTSPEPRYAFGTLLRVTQAVRVGHQQWVTRVVGRVESEGLRPVGGMEMGGKSHYCHQPTLTLRREDGELTVVALDANTQVETIDSTQAHA